MPRYGKSRETATATATATATTLSLPKSSAVSFDTTATPVRRHVSQPIVQSQVNVQPPTPSMAASNSTKMARGHAKRVLQTLACYKLKALPVTGILET